MMRIPQAESALICIDCKSSLTPHNSMFVCNNCKRQYLFKNGKIFFEEFTTSESAHDYVYLVKRLLKNHAPWLAFALYRLLNVRIGEHAHTRARKLPAGALILNIGSGAKPVDPLVVNIDLMPEIGVDIVANAYTLPFQDNCADMVICESLFEHLEYPEKAVREIRRVLKPGGEAFIVTPFMFGVHSSPGDYYRWTIPGMKVLLNGFSIEKSGVAVGPTGAFSAIAREWFAMVLSFNNQTLYHFWLFVFMALLIPLNIFDYLLSRYSFASQIGMEYYFVAKKT